MSFNVRYHLVSKCNLIGLQNSLTKVIQKIDNNVLYFFFDSLILGKPALADATQIVFSFAALKVCLRIIGIKCSEKNYVCL